MLTLTPVALTGWFLVQLFELMDGMFAPVLSRAVGMRIPGLGLALTLLVILVLGFLSTNVFGSRLIAAIERVIARIPIAKTIYGGTKGVLEAVSREQTAAFQRVVLIEYPSKGLFALAFVSGGINWRHVSERTNADMALVFLPTTPNPTSGFLLLVPVADIIELPFTVEEGIRMVISAGVLLPEVPLLHPVQPMRPDGAAAPP